MRKSQQKLRNTPDREVENPRANKNFQVPKSRLQSNRARGEKETIRKSQAGIWDL